MKYVAATIALILCAAGCGKEDKNNTTDPTPDAATDMAAVDMGTTSDTGGRADGGTDMPRVEDMPNDASLDMSVDLGPALASAEITFPFGYLTTYDAQLEVHGTATDAVDVTVNGVAATTTDDFATWTATIELGPWDNVISASAIDVNGQATTTTQQVRLDAAFGRGDMVLDSTLQKAWSLNGSDDQVIEFDLATGARRLVAHYPKLTDISHRAGPAYDPVGQKLYCARQSPQGEQIDEIDIATGAIRVIAVNSAFERLIFTQTRGLMAVGRGGRSIHAIDLTNGADPLVSGENEAGDTRGSGPLLDSAWVFWDSDEDRFIAEQDGTVLEIDAESGDRAVYATIPDPSGNREYDGVNDVLYSSFDTLIAHDLEQDTVTEVLDYGGYTPGPLRLDQSNGTMYRFTSSGLLAIDLANPAERLVSSPAFPDDLPTSVGSLAPFPDELWAISDHIFTLNYTDHAYTEIFTPQQRIRAITSTDTAVWELNRSGEVRRFDVPGGAMTQIVAADHPELSSFTGLNLAVDATGQRLFMSGLQTISMYDIGTDTIALLTDNTMPGPDLNGSANIIWHGDRLLALAEDAILTVDLTTGEKTSVFTDAQFDNLSSIGVVDADTVMVINEVGNGQELVFVDLTAQTITRTVDLLSWLNLRAPIYDPTRELVWFDAGVFVDLATDVTYRFAR